MTIVMMMELVMLMMKMIDKTDDNESEKNGVINLTDRSMISQSARVR